MIFDVSYALELLPMLLRATIVTVIATVGGFALAMVIGLVLALGKLSGATVIRLVATGISEFIRTTPLLIQLFFLFFVLPRYGLAFGALATGIVGLGLHYGAYLSEVYRAGIAAVPQGQWEAATSLDMSRALTWRRVILPQAIPPIIPPMGNYLIAMFKDTPILATIGAMELLGTAFSEAGRTYRYLEPITLVGLIFLALSYPSVLLVRRIERRLVRA